MIQIVKHISLDFLPERHRMMEIREVSRHISRVLQVCRNPTGHCGMSKGRDADSGRVIQILQNSWNIDTFTITLKICRCNSFLLSFVLFNLPYRVWPSIVIVHGKSLFFLLLFFEISQNHLRLFWTTKKL